MSQFRSQTRSILWLAALVGASVVFTFGFSCAAPLAAFSAISAMTLNRRDALLFAGAVWLANQLVGFTFLNYPTDATTLAWGAALGAITLMSTDIVGLVVRRQNGLVWTAAAFLLAFGLYQGGILGASFALNSGFEAFAPEIVAKIFALNAVAFAGLLVAGKVATTMGLTNAPAFHLSLTERHV